MVRTPRLRKLGLTAHVSASVGWLGALAAFLAHAVAALVSQDPQTVRAADIAMGTIAWFVILPLCLASLVTGLVQALGTPWGLVRNYWVVAKLLLAVLATGVLLLKLQPIGYLAAAARAGELGPIFSGLRLSLMAHAAGGLLVLLATTTLAVYKPQGLTPYGLRRQQRERASVPQAVRAPRWVKAFGVFAALLFLLIAAMLLVGGHGPGAHVK